MNNQQTIVDLKIRRGELRDQVSIAAFNIRMAMETESKRLDPYKVTAGVRAALADPLKGVYFVAETNGRLIGQLMVTREWSDWRNADIWWVQSVYVLEEFRKQGVFKALYEAAVTAAREDEVGLIRLYVEHDNTGAQAAYEKLGLRSSGYSVMEQGITQKD